MQPIICVPYACMVADAFCEECSRRPLDRVMRRAKPLLFQIKGAGEGAEARLWML
jgi:hypothetical protein